MLKILFIALICHFIHINAFIPAVSIISALKNPSLTFTILYQQDLLLEKNFIVIDLLFSVLKLLIFIGFFVVEIQAIELYCSFYFLNFFVPKFDF